MLSKENLSLLETKASRKGVDGSLTEKQVIALPRGFRSLMLRTSMYPITSLRRQSVLGLKSSSENNSNNAWNQNFSNGNQNNNNKNNTNYCRLLRISFLGY